MATSSSRPGERWGLAGATALVTRGSKGIGRAIVEELASFGAAVHTCARSEAELGACVAEWKARGFAAAVTASVCDVSLAADREALAGRVAALFDGKLSILVNNAGGVRGEAGGGAHGGGFLARHGHQLRVVLPPEPARAPAPQGLREGQHRQHLLHQFILWVSLLGHLRTNQRSVESTH